MAFRLMVILGIVLMVLLGCQSSEQEIIVVPDSYSGFVLVLFNQKNGEPINYHEKRRVYSIPSSGILKTQFRGNYGNVGFAEFYNEAIDPASKLQGYSAIEDIPQGQRVGLIGSNGTVRKSADTDERIEFVKFFIGTKSEIIKAQSDLEKINIVALSEE